MRLIDADELLLSMMLIAPGETKKYCYPCREILKEIDDAPTIEPQRTGKWLECASYYGSQPTYVYSCSGCGLKSFGMHNFCPNCGCRMTEDKP